MKVQEASEPPAEPVQDPDQPAPEPHVEQQPEKTEEPAKSFKYTLQTMKQQSLDSDDSDMEIVEKVDVKKNIIEELRSKSRRKRNSMSPKEEQKKIKKQLSWRDERLIKLKQARIIEAKKRQRSEPEKQAVAEGDKEKEESVENGENDVVEKTVDPAEDVKDSGKMDEEYEEEESEASFTDSSASDSGESNSESEDSENEGDESEDEHEIKPTRKQKLIVDDEEEKDDSWMEEFEPTAVASSVPPMAPKMADFFERIQEKVSEISAAAVESQVPEPSFYNEQSEAVPEPSHQPNDPNMMDEDDESYFQTIQIAFDNVSVDGNDSVDETMTERSVTPSQLLLTDSQREELLRETEQILADTQDDTESVTNEGSIIRELSLIDTLKHATDQKSNTKGLKRLMRAEEVIAEDDAPLLPKTFKQKKVIDDVPQKKTAFVENEAEVEEDEFMFEGGADGDRLDNEKALREELAAFIDEDEEVIAKMTLKELEERLKQDDQVRKLFNLQVRDKELKDTKVLVRDIATGKILEKRKHGQDVSVTELEKFGRAMDEEEDENALKELDTADYGLFGDIVNKYMAIRREAQRKNELKKRKRQGGNGSDDEKETEKKMFIFEDDDADWTNETNVAGGVQITGGHVIETDMEKLEEKVKRQAVVSRIVKQLTPHN